MTANRPAQINRRTGLQLAAAAGTTALLGLRPADASAAADERTVFFEQAWTRLVGDRKPLAERVKLELPELAENGNMVPYTISVDSPMSGADFVKNLRIFSTGNPQPVIATFSFSENSGRATVSGRLRLARTQDVIAVAELADGRLVQGMTRVEVTVGGCGG